MAQFGMSDAHKATLRNNRLALVKQLHVDDSFLAILMQHKILSEIQKENIDAIPTANRSKRASWVLDFIPKKGPTAMKAFIYALMDTEQRPLADMVEPELANQWRTENPDKLDSDEELPGPDNPDRGTGAGTAETASGAAGTTGYQYERDGVTQIMYPEGEDIDIKIPITDRELANKIGRDRVLNYPVVEKGKAVIINNKHFDGLTPKGVHLGERKGTNQDVTNLNRLFERLGYNIECWTNCTKKELEIKLADCKNSEEHGDSFVMVILSHGYNGGFYSADSQEIPLKNVVQSFSEWLCLSLRGKPKLFFVQACQGTDRSEGVSHPVEAMDDGDGPPKVEDVMKKFNELGIDDKDITRESTLSEIIGDEQNVFLAFSTVPKYVSIRHERNGTWFIRDLVTVIASNAHEKHLQDMMTEVISRVSKRKSKRTLMEMDENNQPKLDENGQKIEKTVEYVQISCTKDSMSKKVYFLPGIK